MKERIVRLKPTLLLIAVLLFNGTGVQAGLTFVLTPSILAGARSNEVFFTGTLSNTDPTNDLYLNDIQIDPGYPLFFGFTADTNVFFANVPGILSAGQTYSDIVFGVTIKTNAFTGDYFGTISILGGSNIFASSILATQTFQVSTIDVSITANIPNAYKFGSQPGSFVITRNGGNNVNFFVNYAITGTASNGVNYSSITNSVAPTNASASTITILPLADNQVDGDRTVALTLLSSPLYNLLAPVSATVTIHDTPFNAWRILEFGTNATNDASSGDLADPDGDGIVNLLEYALNLNPNVAGEAGLPTTQIDPGCGCLTLTYTRVLSATDLVYTAEAAGDPGGLWSTNGIVGSVLGSDGVTQTNKASDAANPIATIGHRFMHLRVTRSP